MRHHLVPANCISLFGTIQPAVFDDYLNAAVRGGKDDDGLVQRIQLLVLGDEGDDWQYVDAEPDILAIQRAYKVFWTADQMNSGNPGAIHGDGLPFLSFTPSAQRLFNSWIAGHEAKLRDPVLHHAVRAHFARFRSLVPSLALLFHIADVTGLVDSVERDSVESGGRAGQGLRARLREREAKVQALRLEVDDLQARRDALQQTLLDAQVVMAAYRSLPEVLDEALKPGAGKELQALLHEFIDVVGWKEDPADCRRGTATIKIFELPEIFWRVVQGQKEGQPREPMRLSSGSLSCPVWLPSVDLNHGHGD